MSDRINIQKRAESLSISPEFGEYSRVLIHVSDNTVVEAGDSTGRTLEFENPFGTETIAQEILAKLRGFQYQPYEATGAILDPAAEMGDAISIHNVYGGMYKRARKFGQLMKADISAPRDEEIDHEFPYESPAERKFTRQIDDVRASILIQAGLIEAKVSKTSPTGQTSFSWAMNDTSHTWYANGNQVMKVSESGLEVNGRVTATSGFIGSGSSGFTISANAIYNGMTGLDDTMHNGVYIGTGGIALGKGKFKVTNEGNVTANNLTANNAVLTGTLKIGGTNITAAALRSGAASAYGWANTKAADGTTQAGRWSTGSGYGYNYNAATQNGTSSYPTYFQAKYLTAVQTVSCNKISIAGVSIYFRSININGTNYYVALGSTGE